MSVVASGSVDVWLVGSWFLSKVSTRGFLFGWVLRFSPLHLLGSALGEAQGMGDSVQLLPLVDGVFQGFARVLLSSHAFREASVFSFQVFSTVLSFDSGDLSHILFSGFPSSGVFDRCCLSRVEHSLSVKVPWRFHLWDSLVRQWVLWAGVNVAVIESFDYFYDVFELVCCGGCFFFQVTPCEHKVL